MLREKLKTKLDDYKLKLKAMRQSIGGQELPDPTPIAPPVGYKRQPTMVDHIREMVRSERLRQEAEGAGFESFEEADDFDTGEDDDIRGPYEMEHFFEPPAPPAEDPATPLHPSPPATPQAQPGAAPASPGAAAPGGAATPTVPST